ncbi:hypothetical protein LVY72_12985 [Arthrobacter sp. I2-34]|uniref:Uncharacterized protein n=1 Tax=Arthrobacter hankyongi TaxID=2904801 RepID=A0ABS9L810_9MICC|nr:hypothetical protein [Arthrobacter hankyongi]MCG2622816.1 hypothetical protein [Arthrobacter hankyongi]
MRAPEQEPQEPDDGFDVEEFDDFLDPNPRHRVIFGPGAFAVGFLSTAAVFSVAVLAISLVGSPYGELHLSSTVFMGLVVFLYVAAIGLVLGAPIAFALGMLLRPVRAQWLHVLAFFVVVGLAAWLIFLLLYGGDPLETVWFAVMVGLCAAIGRASVWRMVTVRG